MNNLSFEFVSTSTKRIVSFLCSSSKSCRGFFGARALSMFRTAVLFRRVKRPRRNSTLDEYVFTRNSCFYEYNECKIINTHCCFIIYTEFRMSLSKGK